MTESVQPEDDYVSYITVGQFFILNTIGAYAINWLATILSIVFTSFFYDSGAAYAPPWVDLVSLGIVLLAALALIGANIWLIRMAKDDNVPFPIRAIMILYTVSIPVCVILLNTMSPLVYGAIQGIQLFVGGY